MTVSRKRSLPPSIYHLVHTARTARVEDRGIAWAHRQSRHSQVIHPGVHRKPVVTAIQALEDAAPFAAHVKRQRIGRIENHRRTPAHGEVLDSGADGLPGVASIRAAEYTLRSGRREHSGGRIWIDGDGPCRYRHDVTPRCAGILGQEKCARRRGEQFAAFRRIGSQVRNRAREPDSGNRPGIAVIGTLEDPFILRAGITIFGLNGSTATEMTYTAGLPKKRRDQVRPPSLLSKNAFERKPLRSTRLSAGDQALIMWSGTPRVRPRAPAPSWITTFDQARSHVKST